MVIMTAIQTKRASADAEKYDPWLILYSCAGALMAGVIRQCLFQCSQATCQKKIY